MTRIASRIVTFIALVVLLSATSTAAKAQEVPYFEKPHIWIDNSANPAGTFSTNFHSFPSLQNHSVTSASVSRFLPVNPNAQMVVHCQAPRPTGVSSFGCSTNSSPTSAVLPGEYSMSLRVIEDQNGTAVTLFTGVLPITVCNGPCSPLFDFTVTTSPLRILANTELQNQSRALVDFNVSWNATSITAGQLVDSNGNVAPGNYAFSASTPRDGSSFGFTGSITKAGQYSLPVTITDEFGVTHSQTAYITVCADEYCLQGLPTLASTGSEFGNTAWFGVGALIAGSILFASRATTRKRLTKP